jgi:hypothetical protein
MTTTKRNRVRSAPADIAESGKVFAGDGRKLEDYEHVGASAPDADPDEPPPARPRRVPPRHAKDR